MAGGVSRGTFAQILNVKTFERERLHMKTWGISGGLTTTHTAPLFMGLDIITIGLQVVFSYR